MSVTRILINGGILLSVVALQMSADDSASADPAAQNPARVDRLVNAFFRSEDVQERTRLIRAIEDTAEGSWAAVADAVRDVQLWSAFPESTGVFTFESRSSGLLEVAYRVPPGYDATRPYPLVFCLPDEAGPPAATLALAAIILGEAADDFALVCPNMAIEGSFGGPGAAADLVAAIRQVRKRIHVDTDRVFAFGYGKGGEAAWMTALMHSDLLAGAVILSAHPRVPFPEQVYAFLLENLRSVPVVTGWHTGPTHAPSSRAKAIAAHSRAIVAFAKEVSLPIVGVEMNTDPPRTTDLFSAEVSGLLTQRRQVPGGSVVHWFQYAAQGRASWLVPTELRGDPWPADQLSILASPATDRDAFVTGVVKGKMAYVRGGIDGQTITLDTGRCARVDLMLPEDLLDWSQPITVRGNGKKRFHGRVRPKIRTLLEAARDQWEFQRLAMARLSFSIKTDATPDG